MNRVFLDTGGDLSPAAAKNALKAGRTFASNGPLLGLEVEGRHPGDTIARNGTGKVHYRVALRSPVGIDHLDLVQNGRVVKSFKLKGTRQNLDAQGDLAVESDGWLVLRAWNDGSDPQVLDLYPYATTSPIYFDLPGEYPRNPADAGYFVAWLDRVIANASGRTDFRTARERDTTIEYLRNAREQFASMR